MGIVLVHIEEQELRNKLANLRSAKIIRNCKTCIFSQYPDGGSCTRCHQFCNWVHNKPATEYLCELCDFCDLENDKCLQKKNLTNCSDEFNVLWKEITELNIIKRYSDKSFIYLDQLFKTHANCQASYDATEQALDIDGFRECCLDFANQLLQMTANNAVLIGDFNGERCKVDQIISVDQKGLPIHMTVDKQSILKLIRQIL